MTPANPSLPDAVDLASPGSFHVLGVAGPGMSAVAILLSRMGHRVSGCALRDGPVMTTLRSKGVDAVIGHAENHVDGAQVIIWPTGFPQDHPEILRARGMGLAVVHRSVALRAISSAHDSIGVLGTHGKTTTTSLLTHILRSAGRDPSFYIGAEVPQWGTGADAGSDGTLVIECDESDDSASSVLLRSAVLTNVDADHLDRYGDIDGVEAEYSSIVSRLDGDLVVCGDDPRAVRVAGSAVGATVCTYGFGPMNEVRVEEPRQTPGGITFGLTTGGETLQVELPLRGRHNALNCAAAVAMAVRIGVDSLAAVDAVAGFGGVERRFAEMGESRGALLVDDYAHLPAEIDAVVRTARDHPSRTGRVIAVFQPNRYHRVQSMAGDYASCFGSADRVYVTDIYASGTLPIPGVTGELVADAVRSAHPDVVWARTREELVAAVAGDLRPGDVCISMGCGDISEFPRQVMEHRP